MTEATATRTNDSDTEARPSEVAAPCDCSAGHTELPAVDQDEDVLEINRHGQLVRKGTANPIGARCRDESGEY